MPAPFAQRISCLVALCIASTMLGDDPKAALKQELSTLKEQMPRIPARTPQESQKMISLHPAFVLDLVACEPLIKSPVAIEFDPDGKLYVAEFVEYNQYVNPAFQRVGSIALLEDTDQDGVMDRRTDFANDIPNPTALHCWNGGLLVGSAPNLLFLKDTNRDGIADLRRVLLTGFGKDEAGEAMLNSFRWGLDSRLHVSASNAGGQINPPDQTQPAISVRSRRLIINPKTLRFETMAHAGQFGFTFDAVGRALTCDNSNPAWMIMFDSRYLQGHAIANPPVVHQDVSEKGKFTQLFRLSESEPWRVVRTRWRSGGLVKGSDEGGKPSGFFTGASGITVYTGDAWPAEFQHSVFVGEVSNNLVYRGAIQVKHGQVLIRRADPDKEFLASRDNWFRPASFAHGPDGNLYLVDMCREFIEAANSVPPEIMKYIDVSSGIDRGRVYRIRAKGQSLRPNEQLSQASSQRLVELLAHPNGWHRATAARLLFERADESSRLPVEQLAADQTKPMGQLHALGLLTALDWLKPHTLHSAFASGTNDVKRFALKLSEPWLRASAMSTADSKQLKAIIVEFDPPEPELETQWLNTLSVIPADQRRSAVTRWCQQVKPHGWASLNPYQTLAILLAADGIELAMLERLTDKPDVQRLRSALMMQILDRNQSGEIASFLSTLAQQTGPDPKAMKSIIRLVQERSSTGRQLVLGVQYPSLAELAKQNLADAQQGLLNPRSALSARTKHLAFLFKQEFVQAEQAFQSLNGPEVPSELQVALMQQVRTRAEASWAIQMLDRAEQLTPMARTSMLETLLSRNSWTDELLKRIESGKLARSFVDASMLAKMREPALHARFQKLVDSPASPDRTQVMTNYRSAITIKGDSAKGKAVFTRACSACHQLAKVGDNIGADLNAIRDRGKEAILLNILDPNRDVKPQYQSYTVELESGRVISGMITSENESAITIRQADRASETIPRKDIVTLKSSGKSFMPEQLDRQVSVAEMTDLLEFLMDPK